MSAPNAWQARAHELATWALDRLVNRTDRCGGYYRTAAGKTASCTRPAKGPKANFLTVDRLVAHFVATTRGQLIGVHALDTDSRGKWLGIDLDAHGGSEDDPQANLQYALHLHTQLTDLGFQILLSESNGRGGYHLLVLFDAPVPGPLLFAFARWLVRDHADHGLTQSPETFPKQPRLTETAKWGNWLRVIGRHHTHQDHWARVYAGDGRWLELDEAVTAVLALTGNNPGLIPTDAYPTPPAASLDSPSKRSDWGAPKPGQRFDDSADWRALLEQDGAVCARDRGDGVTEWVRPGKETGLSATLGYCHDPRGTPLLYVFSTQWPGLEAGRTYTPFQFCTAKRFGRVDRDTCSAMARELRGRSGAAPASCGSVAPTDAGERSPGPTQDSAAELGHEPVESEPVTDTARSAEEKKPQRPAAEVMVELARAAGVVLLHTPDGEAYAQVPRDGRMELYPVRGSVLRQWLLRLYYRETGRPVNAEAMATALGLLDAIAQFDGPECPVYLRVAPGPDGGFVLDLCDERWRVVVIRPGGWEVVEESPVLFRRGQGMRPLPVPVRGSSLSALRNLLNLRAADPDHGRPHDSDWWLVVAWLGAAIRPHGPYPVLHLLGEQGTAKTTAGRLLRRLADPHAVDLRSQPREERDLAVASRHGWVIGYDNLSRIDLWLSDALCRVATGGGFGTRTLYSNDEETTFDFVRPVLVTSIEDVIGQPDLLDRSLPVELVPIPDSQRRTESRLWAEFEAARPGLLGALLDVVAAALERLPEVVAEEPRLPRMADFALFGEAVARTLGAGPGQFLQALAEVRSGADQTALEGSPLALVLVEWIQSVGRFAGTFSELLAALHAAASDAAKKWKGWPANARVLSGQVKRIAPTLRRLGIEHSETRQGKGRTRIVTLSCSPTTEESSPESACGFASAASATPDVSPNHREANNLGADANGPAVASAWRPPAGFASAPATADAIETSADGGRTQLASAPNSLAAPGTYVQADAADANPQPPSGPRQNGTTRSYHPITDSVEEGEL